MVTGYVAIIIWLLWLISRENLLEPTSHPSPHFCRVFFFFANRYNPKITIHRQISSRNNEGRRPLVGVKRPVVSVRCSGFAASPLGREQHPADGANIQAQQ